MSAGSTAGVVIGKVTEVEDPEKMGRVKCRYPHMSDTKTNWISVATIMAGPGRGLYFMPEIDDEVLIAFQQGHPNHPFVIGCLWNQVQKPPAKDRRQRIIKSKNGHEISFLDSTPKDGNKGAIVIRDAHGNVITLTNTKVHIHSVNHIEITASSVNIMGRKVRKIGADI
jgi:uncharacterized protein involved in type VI secretion and phage assembly